MQVMKVTDPLPNRSCCMVLQASSRLSHVLSMSLLSFVKVSQVDLLVHWSCTTLGCEHTSRYRMSGPRATLAESVSDSLWLKHVVEEQGGGHFVGLWQRSPCFFSTVRLTSTLWRLWRSWTTCATWGESVSPLHLLSLLTWTHTGFCFLTRHSGIPGV